MPESCPAVERFRSALRASIERDSRHVSRAALPRGANVYLAGSGVETVYIVDRGEVKMVLISASGRECLLGIETSGDVIGESVFNGMPRRPESATALEETRVFAIPRPFFVERLQRDLLMESFIGYLASRITEQERTIASFVTEDSEQRLGGALLALARKLGHRDDAANAYLRVRISHEELAAMIGTTRPRVTTFMQKFRRLDLIVAGDHHNLIVRERKLAAYLRTLV